MYVCNTMHLAYLFNNMACLVWNDTYYGSLPLLTYYVMTLAIYFVSTILCIMFANSMYMPSRILQSDGYVFLFYLQCTDGVVYDVINKVVEKTVDLIPIPMLSPEN